jgi:predicted RNA-binding Zn-ribbon protein involved in translation (DUF1610 family)
MMESGFVVHTMKCDNPQCGFTTPTHITTAKQMSLWIGRPCPQCGENLLTEKDYKTFVIVENFLRSPPVRFFNWIGKLLHWKTTKVTISTH